MAMAMHGARRAMHEYDCEFERLNEEIARRSAKKVGIQLPAGMKRLATEIAENLSKCGVEVIISGNSCYGACDIDENLAAVVDVLFHFGHSPVRTHLNVVFVELRCTIDVKPAVEEALKYLNGSRICITTTVQHVHTLNEVAELLIRSGRHPIIGKVGKKGNEVGGVHAIYDGQVMGCDLRAAMVECDEILFVGSGDFHPTAIAMNVCKRVVSADPFTRRVGVFTPENLIKKRILRVERAMSASSFGIIVSSKSGQFNMQIARNIREKAEKRGIRSFIIMIDDIREEALCNFDLDAFVITACPRLVDTLSVEKPVISVREFEIVMGERKLDELIPKPNAATHSDSELLSKE
ncbi:diphthamide biosynthesis enzyme Dph2 [Methanosarcinales archaeon]|nr:MAG: diphthamide biosynthesis enzyme Dph2 [Methanosarcinales archaeon]